MPSVLQRRQGLRLLALLAALSVVVVILSVFHFRHSLTATHDAGFTVPLPGTMTKHSYGAAKSIVSADGQFMTLDPSGRFLINSTTNKPVFISGDAAWSLITQLDDSDAEIYLSDRASRGFNYIVCSAVDNYYQSNAPKNYYGDSPFDGPDFTNEDANYWAHVDYVIQRAAAYGITVALDPGFVGLSSPGGYLASYQKSSDEVVTAYGAFLGDRYKGLPNLIWALGGDVDPQTGVVPKLTDLASGIRSKDTVHLIIAEGQPQFAALDTFAGTTWMNLNWLYFHTTNIPSGAASNYSRSPWLPPFQGEGWYENEHSLTQLQLREQGYWAVLSGAYLGNGGFGNNPLWYFNGGPDAKPGEPPWQSQLDSPGSRGEMYLGKLFRSREHWKLVPDMDRSVMIAGYDSRSFFSSARESLRNLVYRATYRLGSASSVAARTSDGQTIIAYIPNGNQATITIAVNEIRDPDLQAKCWWFNPREGASMLIGTFPARGIRKFTPPDANDWVLVIDSLTANLAAPGKAEFCNERSCSFSM
ncbi:MAG TPA: DUF4038 domain-containing protein [Terriglobales bacterium]|jgi:hypothetical protein|nr:DUF4038 domain-containing protein [Terriglobales bacterium]